MKNNNEQEKIIAFYLPQFHAIPENDIAWGKGFTEWTNVKKAKPIYKGQYQPQVPINNNYYDLLDGDVMKKQAELAKKYGVYGFCYYHYYFKNGKKLLEKPLENMLHDKTVDMPFCLSWANEPWSKRWDGSENEIIMEQEYGGKDEWKAHFYYLLDFFKDERYIKDKEGRPIFLIYKPGEIEDCMEMLEYWNSLAEKNGISRPKYFVQYPEHDVIEEKISNLFEGIVQFEPAYTIATTLGSTLKKIRFMIKHPIYTLQIIGNKISNKITGKNKHIFSYDMIVKESIQQKLSNRVYPGAFTSWDNTPRKGENATCYVGSTPKKFEKYIAIKLKNNKNEHKKDMFFINAWNEWGEGAYLEPDEKYQYGYLEAIKNVLKGMEK